mgnify:CR=1 FL=1
MAKIKILRERINALKEVKSDEQEEVEEPEESAEKRNSVEEDFQDFSDLPSMSSRTAPTIQTDNQIDDAPVTNMEKDLENVQGTKTPNERDYENLNYATNYSNVDYENTDRENVTARNIRSQEVDAERTIDVNDWSRGMREMETRPMQDSGEDYTLRARRHEEDTGLPFESKKRRR